VGRRTNGASSVTGTENELAAKLSQFNCLSHSLHTRFNAHSLNLITFGASKYIEYLVVVQPVLVML
jgi:hypothetical protein